MISLQRAQFPSSKDELVGAIDQALRRYIRKSGPIVSARSRVFPYFDELAINLDGAELEPAPLPLAALKGETKPACEAAILRLGGRGFSLHGAPLNLRAEARDVVFHHGVDAEGHAVLVIHKVRDGSAVISAAQTDLEQAIAEIIKIEARKRGITVEQVRLSMRARGSRSVAIEVRLQARKFLLRANIEVSAQIDMNEKFVAKILNLKCKGDGALSSVVCGAVDPHLRQLDGRTFALLSFPLGEAEVRDIRIAVADTVEFSADFGTAVG